MKSYAFAEFPATSMDFFSWLRESTPNARPPLSTWRERAIQRKQLKQLPVHLLKDIGLTPMQAEQEAAKPFWQE